MGNDNGPQKTLKTRESLNKVVLIGRMPHDYTVSSSPIILGYCEADKKMNLIGDGKRNYNLVNFHFMPPLQRCHCYTLLVNANLGTGIWLNGTYNGTSSYAFNLTNVRDYRPQDSTYLIYFTAPEDITTLGINVRSNSVQEIATDFHSCILYEGFVTIVR